MSDIFISYASEDRARAQDLADALSAGGLVRLVGSKDSVRQVLRRGHRKSPRRIQVRNCPVVPYVGGFRVGKE